MYLSRLFLNPRSRQVQSEIARPYQMHKTLMRAFPTPLPKDERVLYRLEEHPGTGDLMNLVQSQHLPDWERLPNEGRITYLLPSNQFPTYVKENPEIKSVDLHVQADQRLAFRLHANPTKKIKVPGKKNGRRVELYKEEEQLEWLRRKLHAAGGELLAIRNNPLGKLTARQNRDGERNTLTMYGVRFNGVFIVNDPQKLVEAVNSGIGSGKALGFGLLSLAPA